MNWTKRSLLLVFFSFLLINTIQAEESGSLLSFYDAEMIKINFNTFGGISFNYQGKNYSPYYGLDSNFMQMLAKDQEVKQYMDSYATQNAVGHVLYWGGFIAMIASPAIIFAVTSRDIYYGSSNAFSNYFLTYSLAVAGSCAASIIGGIMITGSIEKATNGINLYNRNRIKEYN